jgi:type VI secretion system secreted protein Hcp
MRTRVFTAVFLVAFLTLSLLAADNQESRARLQAQAAAQAAKGGVAAVLTFNGSKLDVLAYSWGASNTGSTAGGGGGAGKVNVQDVSLVRFIGPGSTEFFKGVTTGKHYPQATLEMVNDKGIAIGRLVLTDVLVSSYSIGDSAGSNSPTETVSLNAVGIDYILIGL